MDGLDFCFRERRWSEATCGHEECKRIGDIVTPYLCQLARLREEVERLTRERDALIAACISPPGRAEAVAGAFWIVKGEVLCRTEAEAIAAVRQSAGLAGEG